MAGLDIDSVPTAVVTVKLCDFALPRAVTLILAVPAPTPETEVLYTPDAFVVPLVPLIPKTLLSVDAKVTATPCIGAPLASLTVALSETVLPPAVSAEPPELLTVNVAPLICTCKLLGLAEHDPQLAVTVAIRVN